MYVQVYEANVGSLPWLTAWLTEARSFRWNQSSLMQLLWLAALFFRSPSQFWIYRWASRHLCGFSGSKLQLLCLCGKGFIHWSISTQPQVCSVLFCAADSKHIFHNSEVSRTLEDEKQYIEYWGEKSLRRNYKSITMWRKHKFLHKQVAIHYIVWKKSKKEVEVKIVYRKESEHRRQYNSVQILWAVRRSVWIDAHGIKNQADVS